MIKLFLTDVDGCLTDGGMYYSAGGDELKRFCVYDGMGMVQLQQIGIPCGILTSENTPIVRNRARKLNLQFLFMGVGRVAHPQPVERYCFSQCDTAELPQPVILPPMTKLEACQLICNELGISLAEVCFVGDDINDLSLLQQVGFPACPENAVPEVKQLANIYHIPVSGGAGAIRHLADHILASLTDISTPHSPDKP